LSAVLDRQSYGFTKHRTSMPAVELPLPKGGQPVVQGVLGESGHNPHTRPVLVLAACGSRSLTIVVGTREAYRALAAAAPPGARIVLLTDPADS